MSVSIFHITKGEGHNYTGQSRSVMNDSFGALPEGRYKVTVEKVGAYERPSRYRFYWAVILTTILEKVGRMFSYTDPATGEIRKWTNTDEVHYYMKLRFNPRILTTPNGIFIVAESTKKISDTDFINEYCEMIMSEFSQIPYNCEFRDIEDWRAECKAKKERNVSP